MNVTAVVRGTSDIGVAHQGRGHVARAVLHIEPAGDLDLLHFLPGRHGDAEGALDQLVFLVGGTERSSQTAPSGISPSFSMLMRSRVVPRGTWTESIGIPRRFAPRLLGALDVSALMPATDAAARI